MITHVTATIAASSRRTATLDPSAIRRCQEGRVAAAAAGPRIACVCVLITVVVATMAAAAPSIDQGGSRAYRLAG